MVTISVPRIWTHWTIFFYTFRVGRNNAVDDAIGPANVRHKIVVMGSAKVGKTSIITQFLYSSFTTKYKRTIEEMHQGNFSIAGVSLTLDILDTSGSYEVRKMAEENGQGREGRGRVMTEWKK